MVETDEQKTNPLVYPLQIKGIREGLLVSMGDEDWPEAQKALLKQIGDQSSFFNGARLTLDVGNAVLHVVDLSGLRDKLSDQGITLWAVIGSSPTTQKTAQMLGLATKLPAARPETKPQQTGTEQAGEPAILIRKTLRSGVKVSHPGHVIVMGDVNPGAEIVAAGNVLVWGRLRGTVHAGAEGDQSAVISALMMNPAQLRIAGITTLIDPKAFRQKPVTASLTEDGLILEPWIYKEGGR